MADAEILKLYPVRIPGRQTTVPATINADCGVPIVLTLRPPPSKGVEAIIDPYSDSAPGDSLALFCNNIPVDTYILEDGKENDPSSLYVAPRYLLDGLNALHYIVNRGSDNIGNGDPLRAWYHTQRPGLRDQEPSDPYHSQLHIEVEEAARDGIGPEQAKRGVWFYVDYPLMRAFDLITFSCNGYFIHHTVTTLEAASGNPVAMLVNEAALIEAGDDPSCAFSYTVNDWIGNGPDLNAPWSKILFLFLNLKGNWFDKPILSEDPTDPTDDLDTIDLDKLKDKPVIAQIHVRDPWAIDDRLELTCTFTSADGAEEVLVVNQDIVRVPFFFNLPLANSYFAAAVGGGVRAIYKQWRANKETGRSYAAVATIIGNTLPEEVDPPTLLAPAENPIDVLAYVDGVTMRVEHLPALTGDKALLVELNPPVEAEPFPAVPINQNKRADFKLSPDFLTQRHGNPLALFWIWMRDGVEVGRSEAVQLSARRIVDGDLRLPRPEIDGAAGTELDVTQLHASDQLRVGSWPHVPGERVSLNYEGTKQDGTPFYVEDLKDELNTPPGISRPIPIEGLTMLKNGSELKITIEVKFRSEASSKVVFPVRSYNVKALKLVSGAEDWEGEPLQTFELNSPVEFKSGLTFTVLEYENDQRRQPSLITIIPLYGFGAKSMSFSGGLRSRFSFSEGVVAAIEFSIASVHNNGNTISFFDQNGRPIDTKPLPVSGSAIKKRFTYRSPQGTDISYFVIDSYAELDGGFFVDELKWGD